MNLPAPVQRPTAALLGPQEMAFVRAWAEGLDLLRAWQQYLQPGDARADLRSARAALLSLLARLRSQARSHGRPELATLLQRDPEAMRDRQAGQATLDEFRSQQPTDFYSEAELLALFQAEHATSRPDNAARRRQRLRARLVAALHVLDGLPAQAPQPDDTVLAWLDPRLAKRLAGVGIHRLAELQSRIARHGPHWHRGIARLGAVGAARVQAWLQGHQASLGLGLGLGQDQAVQSTTPPSDAVPLAGPAIQPLDRLQLPAGHANAGDLAAISAWLAQRQAGSATWLAYRKAGERWLLWALVERRQALSTLTAGDCAAFQQFLLEPGKSWTVARSTRRSAAGWRPFEAALAPRSVAMTVSVVRALCAWLVANRHLPHNPWDDVPAGLMGSMGLIGAAVSGSAPAPQNDGAAHVAAGQTPACTGQAAQQGLQPSGQPTGQTTRQPTSQPPQLRALSDGQWALLQCWATGLPPTLATLRLQCLVALAGGTGMRLSELASARVGWLTVAGAGASAAGADHGHQGQVGEPAQADGIAVLGKHGRRRWLPLPAASSAAVNRYLVARRAQGGRAAAGPEQALVASLRGGSALSASRLYAVLRQAFTDAASALAGQDAQAAATFQQASTHWLRHTFGLNAAVQGQSATALQALLGHQRASTTRIYRRAAARVKTGECLGGR